MKNADITASEALKKFGAKNLVGSFMIVLFFAAMIVIYFLAMSSFIREGIVARGELSSVRSAEKFDQYLITSETSIKIASYSIDTMLRDGKPQEEILAYMTRETNCIINAIDENFTGVYGYIAGDYLDGSGWTPEAGYVATERPWYTVAVEHKGELALVEPYLDAQTNTVMMTLAKLLSDGESVVAIDINLSTVQQITEEIAKENRGMYEMVLDDGGGVVAHSDKDEIGRNYLSEIGTLGAQIAKEVYGGTSPHFEIAFAGKQYVVYASILENNWYSVSVTDSSSVFAPIKILFSICICVAIVTLGLLSAIFVRIMSSNLVTEKLNVRLSTVADIYTNMYDFDLVNDSFYPITVKTDEVRELMGDSRTNLRATFAEIMIKRTDELSKNVIADFTDLDTLDERLSLTNTVTEEYLNSDNKWSRARFIASERGNDGKLTRVLFMTEIIDKEKRNRDKLLYLSETDRMTGVSNRGSGEHKIREMLSSGRGGMFILLDADKFKSINDTCGHSAGDKVLIAIAYSLKRAFRSDDIIMRLGGDEFAAFAPGVYSQDEGSEIIKRVFDQLANTRIPELGARKIMVSVGAAFYKDTDTFTFEELYKRADSCTYISKEHVGNHAEFYKEEIKLSMPEDSEE